jgi:hypothetical protein
VQRLLDREHDLGLDRVDIGREVVDEVVLGQPGEALGVDVEMRQGGTPRCLVEQGADRLALIESERGDVDQANDVGRVGAERGDDLAPVGVPGNDGWPVLASRATSSASLVIENWGAVTRYPSACKCSMTALQLEPSAQAPCTRTMLGCAVMSGLLPVLRSVPLGSTLCLPCRITHSHRSTREFTYQTTTSTAERRSQPSCQPALQPASHAAWNARPWSAS